VAEPDDGAAPPTEGWTEQTIRTLESLHTEHYRDMSRLTHLTRQVTNALAAPAFVGLVLLVVALWIGVNSLGHRFHLEPFDPYPYQLLALAGSLFAVVTTLLILATQSHENRLDERRSQMTLQMAALSEQKIAKVIALLEEMRRDSPHILTRPDAEAEEMALATDPRTVLDRIVETHRDSGAS
jgi:uncharacterized membrane protein